MAKAKSIAVLAESAAALLQLLVRLKASDDEGYCTCVTCLVRRHYKDSMQGGHFISRKWNATKLLEKNIHPQCAKCNAKHIGGGMPVEYSLYMIDMYGREFVEELIEMKKPHKFYRAEMNELIKELRERISEQENRVCGFN